MFKFEIVQNLLVPHFSNEHGVECAYWHVCHQKQRFNCVFRRGDRKLRCFMSLSISGPSTPYLFHWEVLARKADKTYERVCYHKKTLQLPADLERVLRKALSQLIGKNPFFNVDITFLQSKVSQLQKRYGGRCGVVSIKPTMSAHFSCQSADGNYRAQGDLTMINFAQNEFNWTIENMGNHHPCLTSTTTVFTVKKVEEEMDFVFSRLAAISNSKA